MGCFSWGEWDPAQVSQLAAPQGQEGRKGAARVPVLELPAACSNPILIDSILAFHAPVGDSAKTGYGTKLSTAAGSSFLVCFLGVCSDFAPD